MAKLYYYYGAMGSSKTANALMTKFNYGEVGQKALLCKPAMDTRDGNMKVHSRIGLEEECIHKIITSICFSYVSQIAATFPDFQS